MMPYLGTGKDMKAEHQAQCKVFQDKVIPARVLRPDTENMEAYSPKPWAAPNLQVCLICASSLSPPPVSSPDVPKQEIHAVRFSTPMPSASAPYL